MTPKDQINFQGADPSQLSELESKFIYYFNALAQGYPRPVPQYRFDPHRRWRLDWAWPDLKLGIEIDGAGGGGYGRKIVCQVCGAAVRSRTKDGTLGRLLYVPYPSHGSGAGKDRDAEKANALTVAGWRLLRYTSSQLDTDPMGVIEQVVEMLKLK